jgi:hypothetical protein
VHRLRQSFGLSSRRSREAGEEGSRRLVQIGQWRTILPHVISSVPACQIPPHSSRVAGLGRRDDGTFGRARSPLSRATAYRGVWFVTRLRVLPAYAS